MWVMNRCNIPGKAWFLCLQWVADVMNCTDEESLGWHPPLEVLTGKTQDISILLCFMFWDVVYVPKYENTQMGEKENEIRGRFVGFAWNVGHALTFKILTDDTQKIIDRDKLRFSVVLP